MAKAKHEHIGLVARAMRSFQPVIIFEDRPYTWHSDVDTAAGTLESYKVEGDAIDDDHMKYTGTTTDRGVKSVTEFDHAVAGPVKDAKLIFAKDKVMGEQSDHIGVYTLATPEEFEGLSKKVKAQVTCENFLAHVDAHFDRTPANDAFKDLEDSAEDSQPLVLVDDQRVDAPEPGQN